MRYVHTAFSSLVLCGAAVLAACSSDEAPAPERRAPSEAEPAAEAPKKPQPARRSGAPATPRMPAGWSVASDATFSGSQLDAISKKLGVQLTGLRNTTFDVAGTQVKVNVLTTENDAVATELMKKLTVNKPAEFFVQKGSAVYEFVCANDGLPHARAGREHLAGQ